SGPVWSVELDRAYVSACVCHIVLSQRNHLHLHSTGRAAICQQEVFMNDATPCYNSPMNHKRPFVLRPRNAPRPVRVTEDEHGAPTSIAGRPVARVVDRWRLDDEWW